MPRALLLSVRFHDGRYHGAGGWPPAPARLFQALVAGAAKGERLTEDDKQALCWLESQQPCVIAAPAVRDGRGFTNYVPNNDLDAVGGDPRRVDEIRAGKTIRPRLFDAEIPLLYAWTFGAGADDERHVQAICRIAERLYQLGRGIDMAWAFGEVLDADEVEAKLAAYPGPAHRPADDGAGFALLCPQIGSFASLEDRFNKARKRFTTTGVGKKAQQLFTQAPKPRFCSVRYDSPPQHLLFDLRENTGEGFATWPLTGAVRLVESVRDAAALQLEAKKALPDRAAIIDRVLVGRNATEADKPTRVRITPLPSVGHAHADHAIRRVLVEIPPNCPLRADDVAWAFSGLDLGVDYETGEILRENQPVLTPAEDGGMLTHYGLDGGDAFRLWRTVTPAALPQAVARRRIDTSHMRERAEQKDGRERTGEEGKAATAVLHALRHAGITARVEMIRVQLEPFEAKGARAEAFAGGTRFAKERLWHVEIGFAAPVCGPLVIGDGRYLGLGLMAPAKRAWRDIVVFALPEATDVRLADAPALAGAVRRALMALSSDEDGDVPVLFSGHEAGGGPARSGRHAHVFIIADDADCDGRIDRLVVAAPWVCDHSMQADRRMQKTFDEIVSRLENVRAGRLGVIALGQPVSFDHRDPLVGPARTWESRTTYRATRHAGRRKDPAAALVGDVLAECLRRGFPRPKVDILEFSALPNGGGLAARTRLHFASAVRGPLLLGRDSHRGGGLFVMAR